MILPHCVNCRIGSLESHTERTISRGRVNCRIGSLEKQEAVKAVMREVNCRIGSLEIRFSEESPPCPC